MANRLPDEGILLTNVMALYIQQCSFLMTLLFTVAVQQSNIPFFPMYFGKRQALTLKVFELL